MKTVKQWLETLPEPIKSSAVEQIDEDQLNNEYACLSDAILYFTSWDKTKEGKEFWDRLHDFLLVFEITY